MGSTGCVAISSPACSCITVGSMAITEKVLDGLPMSVPRSMRPALRPISQPSGVGLRNALQQVPPPLPLTELWDQASRVSTAHPIP